MNRFILRNTYSQIGAALIVTAALVFGWALLMIGENARYSRSGVVAQGIVTSKSVVNIPAAGSDAEADYVVGYSFTIEGSRMGEVVGNDLVPRELFNSVEKGVFVDIEYLSHDPAHNRLVQPRSGRDLLLALAFLGLVAAAVGVVLARRGFLSGREMASLESHGAVHFARVIGLEDAGLRTDTDRLFQLVYEYSGPSGELLQGRSEPGTRESFRGFDLGEEIEIRVNHQRPEASVWVLDLS